MAKKDDQSNIRHLRNIGIAIVVVGLFTLLGYCAGLLYTINSNLELHDKYDLNSSDIEEAVHKAVDTRLQFLQQDISTIKLQTN